LLGGWRRALAELGPITAPRWAWERAMIMRVSARGRTGQGLLHAAHRLSHMKNGSEQEPVSGLRSSSVWFSKLDVYAILHAPGTETSQGAQNAPQYLR